MTRMNLRSRSRATRHNLETRLFKLPAELRTSIFELVLVPRKRIIFRDPKSTRPQQRKFHRPHSPALLQTCRQVRREAAGVWYCQNEFQLNMEEYDLKPFAVFLQRSLEFGAIRRGRVCLTFHGEPSWHNVVESLKLVHAIRCIGLSVSRKYVWRTNDMIIEAMLDMLREMDPDMSWDFALRLLTPQRKCLAFHDWRWNLNGPD